MAAISRFPPTVRAAPQGGGMGLSGLAGLPQRQAFGGGMSMPSPGQSSMSIPGLGNLPIRQAFGGMGGFSGSPFGGMQQASPQSQGQQFNPYTQSRAPMASRDIGLSVRPQSAMSSAAPHPAMGAASPIAQPAQSSQGLGLSSGAAPSSPPGLGHAPGTGMDMNAAQNSYFSSSQNPGNRATQVNSQGDVFGSPGAMGRLQPGQMNFGMGYNNAAQARGAAGNALQYGLNFNGQQPNQQQGFMGAGPALNSQAQGLMSGRSGFMPGYTGKVMV